LLGNLNTPKCYVHVKAIKYEGYAGTGVDENYNGKTVQTVEQVMYFMKERGIL
jgi:hypothetical protein